MKTKKEYIILIALILALSLYLFLYKSDRTHYELPETRDIARKDISKIELAKTDASILLEKKGDAWHIEPQGYPADADKVDKMLAVIENLTLTALVSESKSYNRYDLNVENAGKGVRSGKNSLILQAYLCETDRRPPRLSRSGEL